MTFSLSRGLIFIQVRDAEDVGFHQFGVGLWTLTTSGYTGNVLSPVACASGYYGPNPSRQCVAKPSPDSTWAAEVHEKQSSVLQNWTNSGKIKQGSIQARLIYIFIHCYR